MVMNKKDFSRNCLSQAYIELLEERDTDDISIQDIVDKAGFSRMAYYRNFKSKTEMIDWALDNLFDNYIKESKISFTKMGPECFSQSLYKFLASDEMVKYARLLAKHHMVGLLYDQFIKHTQGGFIPNQTHYFYDFMAGGFFSVFMSWVLGGMKETPEQMAEGTAKFFTQYTKNKSA